MKKLKQLLKLSNKKSNEHLYKKNVYQELGTVEYHFDNFNIRCETDLKGKNVFWYFVPLNFIGKNQFKLERIMGETSPEEVTEEYLNLVLLQIYGV